MMGVDPIQPTAHPGENMPAIRVLVDDVVLATVPTDGLDLVTVHVSGDVVGELGLLHVAGGIYPPDEASTYLIWVDGLSLQPGQTLSVQVLDAAVASHAGKTIAEMYPDEPASTRTDFNLTADHLAKLRAMPRQRATISFAYASSSGQRIEGETSPLDHGFGFSLLWDWSRPDELRASLHAYSLESLGRADPPRKSYVCERIPVGGFVTLTIH
jgi:hypothetical protein